MPTALGHKPVLAAILCPPGGQVVGREGGPDSSGIGATRGMRKVDSQRHFDASLHAVDLTPQGVAVAFEEMADCFLVGPDVAIPRGKDVDVLENGGQEPGMFQRSQGRPSRGCRRRQRSLPHPVHAGGGKGDSPRPAASVAVEMPSKCKGMGKTRRGARRKDRNGRGAMAP